ncbi:MAG TPA: carboxymuconolactone decarboxylase family protein [Bacillales bacterium]|nr:carboxymuconolactone decarboxylase family protein [Bacillales bacterium]
MSKRKEIGLENLQGISGEVGVEAVEKLRGTSPELADLITEFAFGDIYSLPALTKRDKVLITLSSILTQGDAGALTVHLHSAQNIGLTNEEIKNVILHCIPYVGFPKVISAMQVFEGILED